MTHTDPRYAAALAELAATVARSPWLVTHGRTPIVRARHPYGIRPGDGHGGRKAGRRKRAIVRPAIVAAYRYGRGVVVNPRRPKRTADRAAAGYRAYPDPIAGLLAAIAAAADAALAYGADPTPATADAAVAAIARHAAARLAVARMIA